MTDDQLIYIPDELDATSNQPRWTVQIVLGRHSEKAKWFVDVTLWSWMNIAERTEISSESQFMCPECYARMEGPMCTKCHTMVSGPGERHAGLLLIGDIDYVSDVVSKVIEGVGYDTDVLFMFLPKPVDTQKQVAEFGRMPLEDALDQSEYRLYTREALAKDSGAGASLKDCLRMFIRG